MDDAAGRDRRGEAEWIATISGLIGRAKKGEIGIGDDAAVFDAPAGERLVFCTDLVVEHVHFDLARSALADVGWKSVAVNLSDLAAMGARPLCCVVGVAGAGGIDIAQLYSGIAQASDRFGCEVLGGDTSKGEELIVSVAMVGATRQPVLRSGAVIGDTIFVTGPLGVSAAGMRLLCANPQAEGPLVDAHRRPMPRVVQGEAASQAGATAMIDISDGFGIDLHHLSAASKVGFSIDAVPVSEGATADEALGGGEDYELLFTAPDVATVKRCFVEAGCTVPIPIGTVVGTSEGVTLNGEELFALGYQHR